MTKNSLQQVVLTLVCLSLMNCSSKKGDRFDEFTRTLQLGNWEYALRVENQNIKKQVGNQIKDHFLKATLSLANTKTKQSLLYTNSENAEDYEAKYKYLSFGSRDDLYIKYNNEFIYPLGYVFEPSNGLAKSERLVFKFQIRDDLFRQMSKDNADVEYWYIDRLVGLGKICFKQQ